MNKTTRSSQQEASGAASSEQEATPLPPLDIQAERRRILNTLRQAEAELQQRRLRDREAFKLRLDALRLLCYIAQCQLGVLRHFEDGLAQEKVTQRGFYDGSMQPVSFEELSELLSPKGGT